MIELITTILLFVLKVLWEKSLGRKLNDAELLNHIENHQKRRAGSGQAAQDFDDAMNKLRKEMARDKADPKL